MYCCYFLFQTVPPKFRHSVDSLIAANIPQDTRLIALSNWSSSMEYCSELQSKDIMVFCRATGIPTPRVEILVNGSITEPYRRIADHEVLLKLEPIAYGEVMKLECQASTMEFMINITVNLTYTCMQLHVIVAIRPSSNMPA